ncbi:MAG: MFS transporter [Alphaproteobacteria bacterium]|jgi:POT family proton-dependent oligopeptide transporter|nr:MFS transporter [Alphaproteobacteria bacterium]
MKLFAGLPKSSLFVLGNETAERFSYYGMRAILILYMTTIIQLESHRATGLYHMFMSANYLMPIFGAIIADRYLGRFNTIMTFSIAYMIGNFTLALTAGNTPGMGSEMGMMIGLTLIAIGSGGIKPCVSALLGDQFKTDEPDLKTKAFNFFYFSINFGSFFASLLIPFIQNHYGYKVAFAIPGFLMMLATIILYMGKRHYTMVKPNRAEKSVFFPILSYAIKTRNEGKSFFAKAYEKFPQESVDGVISVLNVLKIYAIIIVFWSMFDQKGSTWVLQAAAMDLNFLGMSILPSMMPALNPIMVMALIPIMVGVVYPTFKWTPLQKIGVGIFVGGLAFCMIGVIQHFLDAGQKINVMWQFFPYLTLTLAEVLVSITGLEFAYTQSPKSMKSIVTSFWLLTTFLGNMVAAVIAEFNIFSGPMFFYFFGFMAIALCVPYYFLARGYKIRNF